MVAETKNGIDIFTASHDPEAIDCFSMKFRKVTHQQCGFKSLTVEPELEVAAPYAAVFKLQYEA